MHDTQGAVPHGHRYRHRQGSAGRDLVRTREGHLLVTIAKKYERFNAVSSFGAYKTWLAGMMRQAPIERERRRARHRGRHRATSASPWRAPSTRAISSAPTWSTRCSTWPARTTPTALHDGVPVDFEVVDAQDIPYADASYDAHHHGIRHPQHARPPARALRDVSACSSRAGSLVCLEFSTPPNAVWRALYNFYLKHLIPFWGGLITGRQATGFVYLSKSIKAFPNQAGPRRSMMREAGFVRCHLEELHRRHRCGACGEKARVAFGDPERFGANSGNPKRARAIWSNPG